MADIGEIQPFSGDAGAAGDGDQMDRGRKRRWQWAVVTVLVGIGCSLVVQNGWPLFATTLGAIVTLGSSDA